MIWTQTSHCSWETDAARIVKHYKPCRGGIIYTLSIHGVTTEHGTLEKAQKAAEKMNGKPLR